MRIKFRRFLCMVLTIIALVSVMSATMMGAGAEQGVSNLSEVQPEYEIKVEGNKGTVTRLNNTDVVYEDMYIRYSVGFSIDGDPSMMIDLIEVKWAENQEGVEGTFSVPKLQLFNGKITGECFMITTDDRANELTICDVVPNAYGILIR